MTYRRISSNFFGIPKGATYVRSYMHRCCSGERPVHRKQYPHDVWVGYRLVSSSPTSDDKVKIYIYEIFYLRQYDYPICIPVDKGGCYSGDMDGWPHKHGWKSHPCEAIPVSLMLERMGEGE